MLVYRVCFVFSMLCLSLICAAQTGDTLRLAEVKTFEAHRKKIGYLRSLEADSILLTDTREQSILLAVEDIHYIDLRTKRDRSGRGLLVGMAIGSIPGLAILAGAASMDGIEAILLGPATVVLGIGALVGGVILGGRIGLKAGRGSAIHIPINGNRGLYEKQKDQLKPFLN